MWLALASLCVLDQEHVERLSSGQWVSGADGQSSQPRVRIVLSSASFILFIITWELSMILQNI